MASKTTNFPDKKISSLILRKDFSKVFIPASFEQSEFLEINKTAYKNFLEKEIKNLVLSQFPVANPKNTKYEVRCGGVSFTKPLFSIKDSLEQGKSYEASLFADIYIVNNETGEIIKNKKTKSNISSGVFLTNIPLMTDSGTFIINGIEKNVVNQLVKAAGLYAFENAQIRLLKKKKVIETNNCEILPSHGTLMHFHITGKAENEKILLVSMRSLNGESIVTIPVTILLKAMGMSEKNIADVYAGSTVIQNTLAFDKYNDTKIFNDKYYLEIKNNIIKNGFENSLTGSPLEIKLKNLVNEVIKNEKSKKIDSIITELAARYIIEELGISTKAVDFGGTSEKICYQDVLCRNFFDSKYYSLSNAGRYKIIHKSRLTERLYSNTLAQDIVTKDGKVLLKKDQLVLIEELNIIKKALANGDLNFSKQIPINEPCSFQKKSNSIYETIAIYKNNSKQIFNIISVNNTIETTALTTQDLLSAISYTLGLEYGIGNYDDTEDLSNKRLRLVDEQFKKHFSKGLSRIVKFTFEKLASLYLVTAKGLTKEKLEQKVNLRNIVNTKVLQLAVKNFFNTYDLTQFVDQTNPLSELTNKRRISSLGEGGVSREDPNLSIRDIHFTHYGRICPIETPEGANVGLILSLAIYAKVDTNGFILTPYKKVIDGVITDEIEYLTATKEYDYVVASSRTKTDDKGKIIEEVVEGRFHQTNKFFKPKEVNYVDIIPSQILSPSTASVPFIESDDGVRVAYGSNFQRQALPLIEPYAATIGTGFEAKIAADSGFSIVAGEDGEIKYVDSSKIVVITEDKSLKTYELTKYARSNQSTSINQTPIVYVGQKIAKGDLLADGPAIKNGEIALGINPLVAFMH
jgi:DNA-directed RNA polymerase subunit beta